MTFLLIVALSVLAVVLVHLIVGWFLANGLHDEALVVKERQPEPRGIRVVSFNRRTTVLQADGPRQDIGHPGVTTMVFEGGRSRLGDVVAADGLTVTRTVQSSTKTPDPDTYIELNSYVFLDDPDEIGLEYVETTYLSELGPISAWEIPGSEPEKWAIHVHGWTAHRQELLRIQPVFADAGYNSLIIDYRNDEGAPRDPTGRYRFGLTEWKDLEAAVAQVVERGGTHIVLSGCSTGGALIMRFLEMSPLARSVDAIVMDSPNLVLAEAIRHGIQDVKATRLMVEFGLWIADLRWKIDWDATNYLPRADHILEVPALVFHGTSDHRVPIAVSRQLESRVPDHVELVEFPAAGHVMSWNADPEAYETRLHAFLRRVQN